MSVNGILYCSFEISYMYAHHSYRTQTFIVNSGFKQLYLTVHKTNYKRTQNKKQYFCAGNVYDQEIDFNRKW